MIRLILVGATGWLLATRPELRERIFGAARSLYRHLATR